MKHILASGVIAAGILAFLGTGTTLSAQSTPRPVTRLAQDTICGTRAQPLGSANGVTDSAGINKSAGAPASAAKGMTDSAGINKAGGTPAPSTVAKGLTDSAGINKSAGAPTPLAKGLTDSTGINKSNGTMNPCPAGLGAGVGMDSVQMPAPRPDAVRPPNKP